MSESLNDMLRQSQKVTDEALEKGRQVGEQGANKAYDSIVSYTQEHPLKSLAIAAGAGALVFVLLRALSPTRD